MRVHTVGPRFANNGTHKPAFAHLLDSIGVCTACDPLAIQHRVWLDALRHHLRVQLQAHAVHLGVHETTQHAAVGVLVRVDTARSLVAQHAKRFHHPIGVFGVGTMVHNCIEWLHAHLRSQATELAQHTQRTMRALLRRMLVRENDMDVCTQTKPILPKSLAFSILAQCVQHTPQLSGAAAPVRWLRAQLLVTWGHCPSQQPPTPVQPCPLKHPCPPCSCCSPVC